MDMKNDLQNKEIDRLLKAYPQLATLKNSIYSSCKRIEKAFLAHNFLYICGNGGSAADAEHIAGELLKGFLCRRPLSEERCQALEAAGVDPETGTYLKENLQQGFPVVSLTGHIALNTAMSNDVNADLVFAQQLNALGTKGDVLLAISTSGNARNVELCCYVAQALGMDVIGLTGRSGGRLQKVSDILLSVPESETPRVQELHVPLYHTLCTMIEAAFFSI